MKTFGSVMSFEELEVAVRRICHQASLPRDEQLATMQADIIDHWLKRRRALGAPTEYDEHELVALATRLRVGEVDRLFAQDACDAEATGRVPFPMSPLEI